MLGKHSLGAGVSIVALAMIFGGTAKAQSVEGDRQIDVDFDAHNLLEIDLGDPPVESGEIAVDSNPFGFASAEAIVSCAEFATCSNPGAYWQTALGSHSALNEVRIDGSLAVRALADAGGSSALAGANIAADALRQRAQGPIARNDIELSGSLDIAAEAHAAASVNDAEAWANIAGGVHQSAAGAGEIGISLLSGSPDTDGEIQISAIAEANAPGHAAAGAGVNGGLWQTAYGYGEFDQISLDLQNTDLIQVSAYASAAGQSAEAYADIGQGIGQAAYSFGKGGQIDLSLGNSGTMIFDANANATGISAAYAAARVVRGIYQSANEMFEGVKASSDVNISFVNSGSLEISADAGAQALSGPATAVAAVELGIHQRAGGDTIPVGTAAVQLTNSGNLTMSVNAQATGDNAFAAAQMDVAVSQMAWAPANGAVAAVSFDNGGTLDVALSANAYGETAHALGLLDSFIWQLAVASGTGGVAQANLNNSGQMAAHVNVEGVANGDASVLAILSGGIEQYAFGSSAAAHILNDGLINLQADAAATAASGNASAIAFGGYLLVQQASGAVASANIENDGTIALGVAAHAEASATAHALALFSNAFIQSASATKESGSVAIGLNNSGNISISALASAEGTHAKATAAANEPIILQEAIGDTAAASLTNTGSINLWTLAKATATGFASALADIGVGIGQYVDASDGGAIAVLDNQNAVQMGAVAMAYATEFAIANAHVAGISQVATAVHVTTNTTSSPDGKIVDALLSATGPALATISNSGDLAIAGMAVAVDKVAGASSSLSAIAVVNVEAAQQTARGTDAAALIDNQGTIAVDAIAIASAEGGAFAIADNAGFTQWASAVDFHQATTFAGSTSLSGALHRRTPNGSGAASFTNSGAIDVAAFARADGESAGAVGGVLGLAQHASGETAEADFENASTFNVNVGALALGGNEAAAFAIGSGVKQSAFAVATFSSFEDHSGHSVHTSATVVGPAHIEFTNSGELSLGVQAMAYGTGVAIATAIGNIAVRQNAIGTLAAIDMLNGGTFDATAVAIAHAEDSAAAFGQVTGVLQLAQATLAGATAEAAFKNTGSIDLKAVASASANLAAATVNITTGIDQVALADIRADASMFNEGSISFEAVASADGGSLAIGHAWVGSEDSGAAILQFVLGNEEGSAALTNSSTIEILASANADAAPSELSDGGTAQASATIFAGVRQLAFAISRTETTDSSSGVIRHDFNATPLGAAEVSFENLGMLTVAAHASAQGDVMALASGIILGGVVQEAQGTLASVNLDNSDGLLVAANAQAVASHAAAIADVTGVIQRANAGRTELHSTMPAQPCTASCTHIGFDAIAAPLASASISLTNSGAFAVAALAYATNTAGASALAQAAAAGIVQTAAAVNLQATSIFNPTESGMATSRHIVQDPSGSAFAKIDNSGLINVGISGRAESAGIAVVSQALNGIVQAAAGTAASALVVNYDTMNFHAAASAVGERSALAVIDAVGIRQVVNAYEVRSDVTITDGGATVGVVDARPVGSAVASLTNDGSIAISAIGHVDAGSAMTESGTSILTGNHLYIEAVDQLAQGLSATATLNNAGLIDLYVGLSVQAARTAWATEGIEAFKQTATAQSFHGTATSAPAGSLFSTGTTQGAGVAHVAIINSDTIDIDIAAIANGGAKATDRAYGIVAIQKAFGLTDSASFDNSGAISVDISVSAKGGTLAHATATADAVQQRAVANDIQLGGFVIFEPYFTADSHSSTQLVGLADLSIVNSGTIELHALANGSAEGAAYANANAHGYLQLAKAAEVSASIVNNEDMEFIAQGVATGTGFAAALISAAGALQELQGLDGVDARIENSGTWTIAALGYASADQQAVASGLLSGFAQFATVTQRSEYDNPSLEGGGSSGSSSLVSGPARADIVNSGSIDLIARAVAIGGVVATSSGSESGGGSSSIALAGGGPAASAFAGIAGIQQGAAGDGAYLSVDNKGSLSIAGSAYASAETAAIALVQLTGMFQVGTAVDAYHSAIHGPSGGAVIHDQHLAAGEANALISNDGTLDLTGRAVAIGGTAVASAGALAIDQRAVGSEARAEVINPGTIDAQLTAFADGGTAAYALVAVHGIAQSAEALDYRSITIENASSGPEIASSAVSHEFSIDPAGRATANLVNSGTLAVSGAAHAIADEAPSSASAFTNAFAAATVEGASQIVFGETAQAMVANRGSLIVTAQAMASGETSGLGKAAAAGVEQLAFAVAEFHRSHHDGTISFINHSTPDGSAVVHLDNEGSLVVAAQAEADAATFASGFAVAGGARQVAEGETAEASLNNIGAFNVQAAATAQGEGLVLSTAKAVGVFQSASAVAHHQTQQFFPTQSGYSVFSTSYSTAVGAADVGLTNSGSLRAFAVANAQGATADALASAAAVQQIAVGTDAQAGLTNTKGGVIAIGVDAGALAPESMESGYAIARAAVTSAIDQFASASGDAGASLVNQGMILVDIDVVAEADGNATAQAHFGSVYGGIFQRAEAGETASASLSNSGMINIAGDVTAQAKGHAEASAYFVGVEQLVSGGKLSLADASNGGLIHIDAAAGAEGSGAHAAATAARGMAENLYGLDVTGLAYNSGTVALSASANAVAESALGLASARARSGVAQFGALASAMDFTLTNDGLVSLNAVALASGAGGALASGSTIGSAQASAIADVGLLQRATLGGTIKAEMKNSDTVVATAKAAAIGNGGTPASSALEASPLTGAASALAEAYGMGQSAFRNGAPDFAMSNSGIVNVKAAASADAIDRSRAYAQATGAFQSSLFSSGPAKYGFANSGTLTAMANADAGIESGSDARATASANGLAAFATSTMSFVIENALDGDIVAIADAKAPDGLASAVAAAIQVTNEPRFGSTSAFVTGTIDNAGSISVLARASGPGGTAVRSTGSGGAETVSASSASAAGISVKTGAAKLAITNSGLIQVDAVVKNGGSAAAYGIRALDNGAPVRSADPDGLTVTNDGGVIIARESDDGGKTWRRGSAIDVSQSLNSSVINLLGDGSIYGNIDIQDGDEINVEDGRTSFDGIVNSACAEDPSSLCGVGVLNISDGGELFLRNRPLAPDGTANPMYDGPAYVFVNELNVATDGAVVIEVPMPDHGGAQPLGSYSQIFTDVANLDGSLLVRIESETGLFADSYSFDNVIDANAINGSFAHCGLDGIYADSVLLEVQCVEDDGGAAIAAAKLAATAASSGNNIDINVVRLAFNEVEGLGRNAEQVGEGLECIYDPDLTGGVAAMFADLFTMDGADYAAALDQLAGSAYASYLQSFNSLGVHYNDLLAKAGECAVPAIAGSSLDCRTSHVQMWAQIDLQNRRAEGDAEGGGYDGDRWTALVGIDANVGPDAIAGASIGKVANRLGFNQRFSDEIKADGYQLGAYGIYDPGRIFVKAMGTYSWFDGDAQRTIDFRPLQGTINGELSGDPDVRMWTLGAHMGARLPISASSALTPYFNVDHTNIKLKGFTERGLDGPELTVKSSTEKRTTLTGGIKWASNIGGFVPELDLGYRYQLGNRRSNFAAAFLGDEDCDFDIVSQADKRGSFLAGLSIGGKAGPVDVRVGYQGLFGGTATSHSANFKLVLPFGGGSGRASQSAGYAPPPPR